LEIFVRERDIIRERDPIESHTSEAFENLHHCYRWAARY